MKEASPLDLQGQMGETIGNTNVGGLNLPNDGTKMEQDPITVTVVEKVVSEKEKRNTGILIAMMMEYPGHENDVIRRIGQIQRIQRENLDRVDTTGSVKGIIVGGINAPKNYQNMNTTMQQKTGVEIQLPTGAGVTGGPTIAMKDLAVDLNPQIGLTARGGVAGTERRKLESISMWRIKVTTCAQIPTPALKRSHRRYPHGHVPKMLKVGICHQMIEAAHTPMIQIH